MFPEFLAPVPFWITAVMTSTWIIGKSKSLVMLLEVLRLVTQILMQFCIDDTTPLESDQTETKRFPCMENVKQVL